MKTGLLQEQTLRLAMTQELRQAIMMLQYNSQELTEFLYEKSLENPLIELRSFDKGTRKKQTGNKLVANQMEIYSANSLTIQQHVLNQFKYYKINEIDKRMLSFIVLNMDENGYLQETDEELASLLSVTEDKVRELVELVQALEPAGVGARNLQECLTLQLKRLQNRSSIAEEIVEHHFANFVKKDWRQLTNALKCKMEDLQVAVNVILSLQPKPGLAFSSEKPLYIVPDLVVAKVQDRFVIRLNEKNIPKIEINAGYSELLHNKAERDVVSYVSEKYQQVQWLLRSLEQRKKTLLSVMEVILTKQTDFFRSGPLFLKPLSLREVADELGLHESTISRATRHKYVQTPYGLVEMKYFFSNSVLTGEDEAISTKRVKELIKGFVDKEEKKKPLSDQKIVQLLQEEHNILVSRRTVAKYREQLHIPASSRRKSIG